MKFFSSLLFALGLAFMTLTVLEPVFAAAPFVDDFEACPVGLLGLCSNWYYTGSHIQTAVVHSGSKAVETSVANTDFKEGDNVSSGDWYFSVRLPADPVDAGLNCIAFQAHYDLQQGICFKWNMGSSNYDAIDYSQVHEIFTGITAGVWHTIGASWSTLRIAYNIDGGDYQAPVNLFTPEAGYISAIHLTQGTTSTRHIFIDDLSDIAPPPATIAGYDPILTPTAPLDYASTKVTLSNFNITGALDIPTSNPYTWTQMIAEFKQVDGIDHYTETITLPNLVGGQSYNYSATSSIPVDKAFEVYYLINGYSAGTGNGYSYIHRAINTYIYENSPPAGGIPYVPAIKWVPPILENCTGLDILQTIACNIQNALLGMIIPSESSVNQIFGTFQLFQQKFPFNYISAIGTSLSNIRTSLNESATISIKVFGQSGNVSLAFWNTAVTIAGVSTTIGAVLKLILTFFLLLIFLFWGIGYLHRFV